MVKVPSLLLSHMNDVKTNTAQASFLLQLVLKKIYCALITTVSYGCYAQTDHVVLESKAIKTFFKGQT